MKLNRNDLCHCGSGKKYKKCCLVKDEMREIPQKWEEEDIFDSDYDNEEDDNEITDDETFKTEDDESYDELDNEDEVDDFDEDEEDEEDDDFEDDEDDEDDLPEINEEDEKLVDEWWANYKKMTKAKPEEIRLHLENFMDKYPNLVLHLELHHEVLFELGGDYLKTQKYDEFIEFLLNLRINFPDSYIKSFGYYDSDIIAWLITKNRTNEVKDYLNNFIKFPVRFVDKLFGVVELLKATNNAEILTYLVENVYEAICKSNNVLGGFKIVDLLATNLFSKYIYDYKNEEVYDKIIDEVKTLKVELSDNVYTKIFWSKRLERINREYIKWETTIPKKKNQLLESYFVITLNFLRFVKEKTEISWITAEYYSELMNNYFHSVAGDSSNDFAYKPKHFFDFSEKTIEKTVISLSKDMFIYYNTVKMISIVNAIFYFAEYLAFCNNIDEGEKSKIQDSCKKFNDKILPALMKQEIDVYYFTKFPIWKKD